MQSSVVKESVRLERLSLCNSCEYQHKEHPICTACGCVIPTKILDPNGTCPINKWNKVAE